MSIQPAIEILRQIRSLHESLISLAKQKLPVLIKNQIDELMKITKQENKIIKSIQESDNLRRLWIAQYLQSKNFPVQYTITISEFSKYIVDPEEKKALLDEQKLLADTIEKLKALNDHNQLLIDEAIKYIDFSIDLMTLADDDVTYKNPSQPSNQNGRSSIFDSKA